MLTNYFTTAFRNLAKNKVYSLINIMGLAFGLACVFLIINYVRSELSYDRHHQHASAIYRVIWSTDNPQTRTPHPLAQAMVADFEV
jgi:putative ABC transport system permease protein